MCINLSCYPDHDNMFPKKRLDVLYQYTYYSRRDFFGKLFLLIKYAFIIIPSFLLVGFAPDILAYVLAPLIFLDQFLLGKITLEIFSKYQTEFYYYSQDIIATIELMILFTALFGILCYRIYKERHDKIGCLASVFVWVISLYGVVILGIVGFNSYHDFFNLAREFPCVRSHQLISQHIDHAVFEEKKENRYLQNIPYYYLDTGNENSIKLYSRGSRNYDEIEPYVNQRIDIFYLPYTKRVLFMQKCDLEEHSN